MKTKTILTTLALIATLTSCKKQEVNRKDYRTVKIISKVVSDINYINIWKDYNEELGLRGNTLTMYCNDTVYHRCYVGDTLDISNTTSTLFGIEFDIYTQKNGKGSFAITTDYTLNKYGLKQIIVK
jgi:hypothetical protein